MTATGTPPSPPPARPPDAGSLVAPSVRLARDDLRALFKRYYTLLGFTVKEQDGRIDVFEAGSSSPVFSFVFDRKTYSRNQDAKLVTFNSPELESIIGTINNRGKVARAYMPFEFDPKVEFQRAIGQLQAKAGPTGGFVNNGTINLVKHYIGYVPFLMFITRIDFSSVDASTEIERAIIPLIDQGKLPDTIKQRIEYYIDKLGKFFDSEQSHLVNHMPVAGELLEIPDEQIEALVDEATPKLQDKIKSRTGQVEGRLQARLQKEIGILENYYKQMLLETAAAIEVASEKRDKVKVEELEQALASIEKEQKFKTAEYQSIYRLSTQFEVLGAAAVYVPIFFQFKCKIKSVYGDVDYTLDYNIFDKEIIPPTCTCGNAIYQGHVCSNLHFSCTGCTGICADCKVDICSACKPKRCKQCGVMLCTTHAIECDCCSSEGVENRWTCKAHAMRCELCGKMTCHGCRDICKECCRIVCTSCGIFSCKSCGKILCSEHAHECVRCSDADANNRWSCTDHTKKCTFCGGNICVDCAYTCSICKKTFCEVCGVHKCRICGSTTCKDHSHECPSCAENGEKNTWVCDNHILKCNFCNQDFCVQCVEQCSVSIFNTSADGSVSYPREYTQCGKRTCKKCGTHKCRTCGKQLCKDHTITCHSCEAEGSKNPNACPEHAANCDICGKLTCKQHLSEKCSVCGKISCTECESFKCKVCGTALCKQHAYECASCKSKGVANAHVCKAHLARCVSCGKDVCVRCANTCAQCGRISCYECSSIKCKNCGKILCQDHAVPCDKCKAAGNAQDWSCADHVVTCDMCNRHLCLKCEPDIARCNVCKKSICSDCQPHRCKDCSNPSCDQHHGECTVCKETGRAAFETCIDHTYTCKACAKVICKEHSIVCNVCQEIFCTGESCSSRSGDACLPHSFISARDGSRHSIRGRKVCDWCHLAYSADQMDVNHANLCFTCVNVSKYQYYLYIRRTGKMLSFPDFLDIPGDDQRVVVITLYDRPFKIPTKQQGVSMAENDLALIFSFNSRSNSHTLVHVKSTGSEILYTRPGVGSKIKSVLSKGGIAPEVVLQKSILIDSMSRISPHQRMNEVAQAQTSPGERDDKARPSLGQEIRVKVQKLFAVSIRIKLDMLRRVLEMEQGNFDKSIFDGAPGNGLTIENGHVIVAKSDVVKFLEALDPILQQGS